MAAVLLAILLLLTIAAVPVWNYSAGWGWYPSGGLALLFIIGILVLMYYWHWA
jgi:hypothetical protein